MAKKAKTRLIHVRLISMAMTGFFYTFKRPRTALPMGLLKYDPIGMWRMVLAFRSARQYALIRSAAANLGLSAVRKKVLFLESKRKGK
ncbi:50S ribosomal protein L33 [Cordyceps fumosorosea ARSEF 2679]|uniref:Large ribosomal subunit protein bL33m n=1 Tax=Cordyceps fumosorosea (strain ARSEF 2679) TaxID=1081104 RepID=A0A168BSC6_CORFA|nr:50S ribosomal protein L33 [Cordyceps fumosorosea ARSEF 2679]OAA70486.1 50S ribosomal protein L33 [Cordyceps fumosorosea ARSEF 2679]